MRFNIKPLAHFINVATKEKNWKISTLSQRITGSGDVFDKYLNGVCKPKDDMLNKIQHWAKENNIPFSAKDCIDFD